VRVIAKSHLRSFWQGRKHDAVVAEPDLTVWFKLARAAAWANFAALKQTYGSADQVGNCVVFDVGNNRFRLVGRVNYRRGIVYVLRVMDHAEYDKRNWITECGCHDPPPKRTAPKEKPAPRPRKRWR